MTSTAASPAFAAARSEIVRARRGTAVVFALHGAVTGSFAARVPWIASHVDLGVGTLGLALLMPGIGALVSLPFSGRLTHRYAYRPLVGVTIAAWCGALVLPALPTTLALFCVTLFLFGCAAGLADMAMNAQGALVERRMGRSVMSSFHGFWSVGLLIGSLVSGLAAAADVDARAQFLAVAVVLVSIGLLASSYLLDEPEAREVEKPPAFALPTRPVLLIGLVGLCSVFAEFAVIDWSAVFIRRELGGSATIAAYAVSAFGIAMATTRLLGDRVVDRLGPVKVVRVAAACACIGAVVVIFAPVAAVALLGFALMGVGTAVVVPLVFAAAGRVGPHAGRSIAGAATVAYAAGLVTPGVVGGIAEASSLTFSYGVVALTLAGMGLMARALQPR